MVCSRCTVCSVVCPCQLFCSAWMCCLEEVINVCNYDMFSVVYVYIDHLKFCVACIDGPRYICCSECNVVSSECNEPTPVLCNLSVRTVVKLCTLGDLALGVSLVS